MSRVLYAFERDRAVGALTRFGEFADQFADCFTRRPQREAASRYLGGLFNESERKAMQAMHGRLSDPRRYQALQHFISTRCNRCKRCRGCSVHSCTLALLHPVHRQSFYCFLYAIFPPTIV